MLYIEFPIGGEFRFILMIFEWIFSIIALELGILFMFRHKKGQYKFKYSQDMGYIFLFFALSFSSIFSVVGSYFSYNIVTIELNHFISQIFLNSAFLIFIFLKEKKRIYIVRQYFFSISLSILLIFFIFFSFLNSQLIIYEQVIFFSIIYFFFILFFIEFIKKAKFESNLSKKVIITFFPFLILLIGLFLTSNYSVNILTTYFRLIGSILQLLGLVFLAFSFLKFSIFSEFDWKNNIEEVFLINKNGACIFYKSYIQKLDSLDKHLITSAITSVNIMIKEILKSGSKETSVIKKKEKLIYLFPGDLITGVIISKKELNTIEFYMKQLIMKIEQVYKNILKNWDGDLDIFDPIDYIFEEIFST